MCNNSKNRILYQISSLSLSGSDVLDDTNVNSYDNAYNSILSSNSLSTDTNVNFMIVLYDDKLTITNTLGTHCVIEGNPFDIVKTLLYELDMANSYRKHGSSVGKFNDLNAKCRVSMLINEHGLTGVCINDELVVPTDVNKVGYNRLVNTLHVISTCVSAGLRNISLDGTTLNLHLKHPEHDIVKPTYKIDFLNRDDALSALNTIYNAWLYGKSIDKVINGVGINTYCTGGVFNSTTFSGKRTTITVYMNSSTPEFKAMCKTVKGILESNSK